MAVIPRSDGDPFQLAGVFIVQDGTIIDAYRHKTAADRPEYEALAACEASNRRMLRDFENAAKIQRSLLGIEFIRADGPNNPRRQHLEPVAKLAEAAIPAADTHTSSST